LEGDESLVPQAILSYKTKFDPIELGQSRLGTWEIYENSDLRINIVHPTD
jgi:hypothetical protein